MTDLRTLALGKVTVLPTAHVIHRDNKFFYRVWNNRVNDYITPEMTPEQFKAWRLRRDIVEALERSQVTSDRETIRFINLTSNDWWSAESRPVPEVCEYFEPEPRDSSKQYSDNERLAKIAASAIEAYLKHIKSGGDPDRLPALVSDLNGSYIGVHNEE